MRTDVGSEMVGGDGSQGDDDVRLDRGDYWDEVPPDLQRRIEEGVERIRRVRASIAQDAQVRYLPPIVVDPTVWSPDGAHIVHAGAVLCPDSFGGVTLAVILGAGPALCRDERMLRALLAHEFAHCFQTATVVIEHLDRGAPIEVLEGDPLDPEREERMLADPARWFGPADQELLRWGDERTAAMTAEVQALVNAGQIPGTQPPIPVRGRYVVPPEWAARIRGTGGPR